MDRETILVVDILNKQEGALAVMTPQKTGKKSMTPN
jgi:hypothetical protein